MPAIKYEHHSCQKTHPRMVLHKILDGARKWIGPCDGCVFIRFLRNLSYFIFCLVRPPDMQISSVLTTTCARMTRSAMQAKKCFARLSAGPRCMPSSEDVQLAPRSKAAWRALRPGGPAYARGHRQVYPSAYLRSHLYTAPSHEETRLGALCADPLQDQPPSELCNIIPGSG